MEQTKALFPVYQMMDKWAAFAYATPEVKSHHHAMYFAFVTICKNKGGMPRFTMPYQTGMELCGIGSKSTYLTALKEMESWGFLAYTAGANRFTVPIIEVHFCPSIGNLLALYRESIGTSIDTSIDTSTDTSTGRNKELLDLATKELEDLKTSLTNERKEAEGVRSGLEKKIEELELEIKGLQEEVEELDTLNGQLKASVLAQRPASQTGGGRSKDPLHFAPFSQSKYATEAGFHELATKLGYPAAYVPYYLSQVKLKTAGLDDRTPEGWQTFIDNFLHNDAKRSSLITSDPNKQTHANGTATQFPQQQRPGQKPTGQAGSMARMLAERRGGPGHQSFTGVIDCG
ncbi:hypothetical protein [Hymenobacter tenuis]